METELRTRNSLHQPLGTARTSQVVLHRAPVVERAP